MKIRKKKIEREKLKEEKDWNKIIKFRRENWINRGEKIQMLNEEREKRLKIIESCPSKQLKSNGQEIV